MASIDSPAVNLDRLTPADADMLVPLSTEAGWNQVTADWRFMLTHGRAFGVRGKDGRWLASALVLPLGSRVAWISMVLVSARERKRGLGGTLLLRCFDDASAGGALAGLDATELGRPVYVRHGFRDLYALRRWKLTQPMDRPATPLHGVRLRRVTGSDLSALRSYDTRKSGFERAHVLAELASRMPALATVAEADDGSIHGYALARDGRIATQIGPVVADREDIAIALMSRAMQSGAQPYVLDVPDEHRRVIEWLETNGATAPRTFMRMVRGHGADLVEPSHIFALAGPELA
jgi:GNAT superfamily N-acetyltransferase